VLNNRDEIKYWSSIRVTTTHPVLGVLKSVGSPPQATPTGYRGNNNPLCTRRVESTAEREGLMNLARGNNNTPCTRRAKRIPSRPTLSLQLHVTTSPSYPTSTGCVESGESTFNNGHIEKARN